MTDADLLIGLMALCGFAGMAMGFVIGVGTMLILMSIGKYNKD